MTMQPKVSLTAFSTRRYAYACLGAAFGLVLGGCAGNPSSKVAQTTQVQYYPTCYQPVQQLRDSDSAMTKSVATGAVIGGLLGAATGALATDNKDKRGRNAAIGAAGGALAGGAVGYYNQKQQQITDDKQRIGSYASDIDASRQQIDRSVAYAQASQNCYKTEFANLLQARKAKTVSDDEGRKRLAEIVAGLQESNALIAQVDGRTSEDLASYTQAYEKDLQQVGVQRQDVVAAATPAPVPATTTGKKKATPVKKPAANVPAEAVTTETSLQKANASRAQSKQVADSGKSALDLVCHSPDLGDWAPSTCKAAS